MLEIKNLYKSFKKGGNQQLHIINGLDLRIKNGEFVTFLGNNGAGKSTLFNLISGSLIANEGYIYLDSMDITFMPEHKRAKFISRVYQSPMMGTAPNLTVAENMALAYGRQNRRNLNWAITKKQKDIFRDKLSQANMGLEDKMDSKIKDLSGGQCQVIALIMSAINPPKLLLLDEHTAALDPKTAVDVMDFTEKIIAKNKPTVLMITHRLDDAIRYGDRLIMLDQGVVANDFKGQEKAKLTTEKLRTLYHLKES